MKKILVFAVLIILAIVYSCGPAAEDRQAMHERAKVFQDSIASVIRVSLAEAEGPAPVGNVVVAPPTNTDAAVPTTTTVATQNKK